MIFFVKITYRTQENPDEILASFRTSYNPRIAVTVEMISTGTDVKPFGVFDIFKRCKSRNYLNKWKVEEQELFHQLTLKNVTPDNDHKTHFIIVDAVGVTESIKTDSRPLERQRSVSFEKACKICSYGEKRWWYFNDISRKISKIRATNFKEQSKLIEEKQVKLYQKSLMKYLMHLDPDKIEFCKHKIIWALKKQRRTNRNCLYTIW